MAHADELISQANSATTEQELAAIEAQAEGRVTVENAVNERRAALRQGESKVSETSQTTTPTATEQEVRESAGEGEVKTDALGEELQTTSTTTASGEQEEQPETGAHGLQLPPSGEVGGGNIKAVLAPPPSTTTAQRPLVKEQAALLTSTGQKIAGMIGRPVTEWGVLGPGDTVKGHMLLLDLNSGEKVRGMDGHRIKDGELYMNLRNVPEALASGDTIERVLGA